MKKELPVCLLLLIGVAACRNNDNDARFKALDEGLKEYGRIIKDHNRQVNEELKEKLQNPCTAGKAHIWQSKAAFIIASEDSITHYIETLQEELKEKAGLSNKTETAITDGNSRDAVNILFEKQDYADSLYRKLIDYNEKVLSVLNPAEFKENPVMEAHVKKVRKSFRQQLPINKEIPITAYFKNASTDEALAMLNKLQNDVAITASYLLEYCNMSVSCMVESFDRFSVIVSQNSSYLKAGDVLEIYAGVGAFSAASKPRIVISGKTIALDADGVAEYKIKAAGKPGKYVIPVKIKFTKPDGSEENVSKNMEYTVEE